MDNQKRTENAIDRAEAMTKMLAENVKSDEEDIYIKVSAVVQLLRELSSVNPQPCEDTISRQAVQDYVAKYLSQYLYNDVREAVEVIDEYIGELPSVTPQPKTGHWIYKQYGGYPEQGNYHCSECDKIDNRIPEYCPHCGCAMVEPQERSDKE